MSAPSYTIGIYVLDASLQSTVSMGIYQFTRNLLYALCKFPPPEGVQFEIWVSEENKSDIVPKELPPWVMLRTARGGYGSGLRRLWADHVLSRHWARRVDAVYFPKGWLPLFPPRGVKCFCHLHDTITRYYLENYPGYGGVRMRYFDFLTAHAVRHADLIFTGTQYSARVLEEVYGPVKSLRVIHSGAFREVKPPRIKGPEAPFLIMGSPRPHKFIPQTLRLLDAYANREGKTICVRMTGVNEFAVDEYAHLTITLTGRLSVEALNEEMALAGVLIYLSEVEGFGLPPLEALEVGTPVCYRNDSSVAEVMQGTEGGWDGISEQSFFSALDAALRMTDQEIMALQSRLAPEFQWEKIVGDFVKSFQDQRMVQKSATPVSRRFGILDLSVCGVPELCAFISKTITERHENSRSICCVNAHIYNVAERDPEFRNLLNACDVLAADGMSVVWLGRLFGIKLPGRCNMTDAFNAWIGVETFKEVKVILIGCSETEVTAAGKKIEALQPHCQVLATHHGYAEVDFLSDWVGKQEKPDMVLVGMGSPKSERLIQTLKKQNAAPLIWHLGGGTIQFLAGTDVEAPEWMRKSGLQWLHRFIRKPLKMSGRYLWGNPVFVFRVLGRWAFPFRRKDNL